MLMERRDPCAKGKWILPLGSRGCKLVLNHAVFLCVSWSRRRSNHAVVIGSVGWSMGLYVAVRSGIALCAKSMSGSRGVF